MRTIEAEERPPLKRVGSGACFHNGDSRLRAVDVTHARIIQDAPSFHDGITAPILKMIEKSMLVSVSNRAEPKSIHDQLDIILGEAGRESKERPSHVLQHHPYGSHESMGLKTPQNSRPDSGVSIPMNSLDATTNGTFPASLVPDVGEVIMNDPASPQSNFRLQLSWKDAQEWLLLKKRPNPTREETNQAVREKTSQVIQALEQNLRNRDHIFFVDTSASMEEHKSDLEDTLHLYCYITKNIDQDGIEVGFTSDGKLTKYKHSSPVLQAFRHNTKSWSSYGFEHKFDSFTDKIMRRLERFPGLGRRRIIPPPKPLSIFVLTDGRWDDPDTDANGAEGSIRRLMDRIKEMGLSRTQVMIQFVSFGNAKADLARLQRLDKLGEELGM